MTSHDLSTHVFWKENVSGHSLVHLLTEAARLRRFQLFMPHQSWFICLHLTFDYLYNDTEKGFMGRHRSMELFDKPTFDPTT